MPIPQASDTINLTDSNAGDASAGNGGDGYNYGDIHYNPVSYVANSQTVEGAYTKLYNGDHVWQDAGWGTGDGGDGGLAQARDGFLASLTNSGSGGAGGDAYSNGDQGNTSGGNVAAVAADTTATQNTQFLADQHATILAGVGGNGGDGNMARGGDISSALVHTNPFTETHTSTETNTSTDTTTDTTTVSNALDHFINAFGSVDLSDIGS